MQLIRDLIESGVIREEDEKSLKDLLEEGERHKNSGLGVLCQFIESKAFPERRAGATFYSLKFDGEDGIITSEEDAKMQLKFLGLLLSHELISSVVYEKLKHLPFKNDAISYFFHLHLACELRSFYNSFQEAKQLKFLELLSGDDVSFSDTIISDNGKKDLLKLIKNGETESYLDFFDHSYCCKKINLLDKKHNSAKKLRTALYKIFDVLCYGSFKILDLSLIDEGIIKNFEEKERKYTIVFDTGVRKHSFSFRMNVLNTNSIYELREILRNGLKFLNTILAEYHAPYHILGIESSQNKIFFKQLDGVVAICRISTSQRTIFNPVRLQAKFLYSLNHISFHERLLSYRHIEYAIFHFKTAGLLSHLNDQQIDEISREIYQNTYGTIGELLAVFPHTIASINENISPGQKPYQDFLLQLNEISHGVLNFTEIDDGTPQYFTPENPMDFTVTFKCDNQTHEFQFSTEGSYFSNEIVFAIVTNIIRKDYPNYRLIEMLASEYQVEHYLFVSKEQDDYLKKMNLREARDRF